MKVYKFGGTSVGSPANMKMVASIINTAEPKIIVLSALSGTTNSLVGIAEAYLNQNITQVDTIIEGLRIRYTGFIQELYSTAEVKQTAIDLIEITLNNLKTTSEGLYSVFKEKVILAQGELLSTALFTLYLNEQSIDCKLIPALNFMRIAKDGEPDDWYIKSNLAKEIEIEAHTNYVTQGYICRNAFGEIDNLKRGGSDYSASLIGAAINAEEIQIWTDIDGMHNNDPRIVANTFPVRDISFDEAAELAYFGAKILHPSSIRPAKEHNIPVRLKNTMEPDSEGTLIRSETSTEGIKAIAAKDNITAIKIKSGRMLLAYGFLRSVFEVFERYRTPIDMITTSEVAVSLTIDDDSYLPEITKELERFGTVEIDLHQSIVCIAGNFNNQGTVLVSSILTAVQSLPVRMISYGGSSYNISILIDQKDKKEALNLLNAQLFDL